MSRAAFAGLILLTSLTIRSTTAAQTDVVVASPTGTVRLVTALRNGRLSYEVTS